MTVFNPPAPSIDGHPIISVRGWHNPRTYELLVSRRFSPEEVDEYLEYTKRRFVEILDEKYADKAYQVLDQQTKGNKGSIPEKKELPAKRGRGRPKGSKNKPKPSKVPKK